MDIYNDLLNRVMRAESLTVKDLMILFNIGYRQAEKILKGKARLRYNRMSKLLDTYGYTIVLIKNKKTY